MTGNHHLLPLNHIARQTAKGRTLPVEEEQGQICAISEKLKNLSRFDFKESSKMEETIQIKRLLSVNIPSFKPRVFTKAQETQASKPRAKKKPPV